MKEWLRAGTIIGTYQILMRIGVSGLGEVYRARDDYQNIDGALKLLPGSLGWTEESARRFVEILKTSPVLQHANISKVLDAGIDQEGRPYVVTEYVRGQSLDEIGIGLARTMAEKIHVAMQIADALEYAHQQGVLHLSLKPSNVMLTATGGVKVLDFVVALATQVALMLRGPNAPKIKPTIGSARYLSPEQVRGEKPTRQSDVFSLGTVCYELFTGQLPFSGRTAEEVTVAIVRDQPMSLTAYLPDAPVGLDEVILKALEKTTEARYQTAAEFAAALKALIEDQCELQFVPADALLKDKGTFKEDLKLFWEGTANFLKEYLIQIAVGTLLMLMALGSGMAYLYFQKEDRQFRLPTEVTPTTKATSSGRVTTLALSPSGTSLAYVTENNGKRTLLYKELAETRETVLAVSPDVDIKGVTLSMDGEWVYYVKDAAPAGELHVCSIRGGQSRKVLSNIAGPVTFSPSGKEFAFVRLNGAESQLVIAPAKSETQVRDKLSAMVMVPIPKGTPLADATPTPTPTAKGVVTKYVIATNLSAESQRVLLTRNSPQFILPQALSWSHDGTRLAAFVKKPHNDLVPEIVSFNVQGGEEKTLCPAPGPEVEGLAWLGGDEALLVNARALTNAQRQVWRINLTSGKTRALTEEHEDFSGLSVSLDGIKALSIKTSRSVSIWLGQDDKAKELTNNFDDGMSGLAWLDGQRLIHASRPGGTDTLWVTGVDGTPPQAVKWARFGGVDIQRFPSVTRNGNQLIFEGVREGQSALYQADLSDLSKSAKPQVLTQSGAEFFPQVDPEGKAIYYTTLVNGRAALMRSDLAGGAATTLLDGKVWRCVLSPDGQQLAANYFDEATGKWKIIVFPATGGQATAMFDAPGNGWRALGWMPNSQSVLYLVAQNGAANLWQQPLPGGPPAVVTSFTRHRLYDFAWSPDGKQLAVVRGRSNDDAMIIEKLK
ncbi:MAG: protein kinase [Acidobacteria bacterium]|nr:protein kinase [Acidobacteriota bacterium]